MKLYVLSIDEEYERVDDVRILGVFDSKESAHKYFVDNERRLFAPLESFDNPPESIAIFLTERELNEGLDAYDGVAMCIRRRPSDDQSDLAHLETLVSMNCGWCASSANPQLDFESSAYVKIDSSLND